MRCKREGPPKVSKLVQTARATPARCLSSFCSTPKVVRGVENRSTISEAGFRLSCKCGATTHNILGHYWTQDPQPNEKLFVAPVSLRCQSCSKTNQLFSPESDGYNGEIESSTGIVGTGEAQTYMCSKCASLEFECAVSLLYTIVDDELNDMEEFSERPQDFFTSFALDAECKNCGETVSVTSYECA